MNNSKNHFIISKDSCKLWEMLPKELPSELSEPHSTTEIELFTNIKVKSMSNFKCNICGLDFADLADQRSHFQSESHRLQLKLAYSIAETDEYDSSSSSSDDEFNNEMKSSPFVVVDDLQNEKKCLVWKAVDNSMQQIKDKSHLFLPRSIIYKACWAILMMRSGKFAGGIFHSKGKMHLHKTFSKVKIAHIY